MKLHPDDLTVLKNLNDSIKEVGKMVIVNYDSLVTETKIPRDEVGAIAKSLEQEGYLDEVAVNSTTINMVLTLKGRRYFRAS